VGPGDEAVRDLLERKVIMPENRTPEEPTQAEIDEILGDGVRLLEAFLRRNPELRPEWKYYGPKNGWSLKVFRKKRNMCFVGREPGAIAMAFILGDRAYDHLRGLDMGPALRKTVEGAKRYPEGHGIRLVLREESDLEDAQLLLDVKGST
jgi:hypothetical protein